MSHLPFAHPAAAAWRHRRALWRCAWVLVLAMGAGCQRPPRVLAAAKVGDQVITQAAFEAELGRTLARYRGPAQPLPPGIEVRVQQSVLGRMIEDAVLAQKAKALQLDITDAQVEARLAEHRQRFASAQAFDDFLARSHTTLDDLRDDLRRAALRDLVVERLGGVPEVTQAQVVDYYNNNGARFTQPQSLRARRILVRVPADASAAERRRKETRAKDIAQRLRRPRADFAKIARQYSDGPEAKDGGDLGAAFARGQLTPELDEVAFALPPHKLSEPVTTRLGIELIEVTERLEARQKPLEEVEASLRASLLARARNDRRRQILQQVRAEAHVEQLIDLEARASQPAAEPADAASAGDGGKKATEP